MMDADLREDGVDRPDLNAAAAGAVAELCGLEVIVAVWRQEGEGGEAFDDGFTVPGSLEALEELLVDQARGHDEISALKGTLQRGDVRLLGGCVAAECQ